MAMTLWSIVTSLVDIFIDTLYVYSKFHVQQLFTSELINWLLNFEWLFVAIYTVLSKLVFEEQACFFLDQMVTELLL